MNQPDDKKRATRPRARFLKSGDCERPDRDADGMPCPSCGGYADRQHDLTGAEAQKVQSTPYGLCGRSWACGARAFKCRLCKVRLIVNAHAPEAG